MAVVVSQSHSEYSNSVITDEYAAYLGDSCEVLDCIPENSIGLQVFSPPFPGMYAYSDSPRDIGNCTSIEEMIEHFSFMIPKLLKCLMPGRNCLVHICQLTAMQSRDGYIGLKDYRGPLIEKFEKAGFIYYGDITIDKNPQIQATRNKEHALLFKSLATDSARMRMCLPDYLLQFRKPGVNPVPIRAGISKKYNPGGGWIGEKEWIQWAHAVWYRRTPENPGGIMETNVLNARVARDTDDEKHLCPLQLDVIDRCVKLWSAPGDKVLSPFMGIGSEGYVSLINGRKFVGIELKPSYYNAACGYLADAVSKRDLLQFDLLASEDSEELEEVELAV